MDAAPNQQPHPQSATCHLPPATCTFILRLRLEWTEESLIWRGWIEHLPSGTRAAVRDWEDVLAFVRGFWGEVEGEGKGGGEGELGGG